MIKLLVTMQAKQSKLNETIAAATVGADFAARDLTNRTYAVFEGITVLKST
jgi:hypothetical protein